MTVPLEVRFVESWLTFLVELLELTARYLDVTGPGLRAPVVDQIRAEFDHFQSPAAQAAKVAGVRQGTRSGHLLEAGALTYECRWFGQVIPGVDRN